jgi:hypothetical protein
VSVAEGKSHDVGAPKAAVDAAQPQNRPAESEGLAGIGVAVTGLVAALAALTLTGTIGRVQRDDPNAILLALVLVAIAGGIWAVAPTVKLKRAPWVGKVVGIVFAIAGFAVALHAAVTSADHEPRPQLSAQLSSDRKTLTTTVAASNLSSNRRIAIAVSLLKSDESRYPLYKGFVGPTSEGTFSQTLITHLPNLAPYSTIQVRAYTGPISSSCDEYQEHPKNPTIGAGTACVVIWLKPKVISPPAAVGPGAVGDTK